MAISTTTYLERTELPRDVMAAYSALDHQTTAELSEGELRREFHCLLARLCAVLAVHGPNVPSQFLRDLSNSENPVDLTASYLESGTPAPLGERSELQQEFVHFSRIVGIGTVQLGEPKADDSIRKLRNSYRMPEDLKVTSELIVVARSRVKSHGGKVATPTLRPTKPAEIEEGDTNLYLPDEHDFLLSVSSKHRRTR